MGPLNFGRWLSWFPWHRRRAREADLERELSGHLELEAEEQRAAGLSARDATRAAHLALGNTARIGEDVRAAWGFRWLEILMQDVRYGLRQLRRNPGFATVVILTLALGIGANTAIFSIVDGVFLRPLPYPQPDELVYALWASDSGSEDSVGAADFLFWKGHTIAFQAAGAYEPGSGSNIVVRRSARFVSVTHVTPGLFATLGISPFLGRGFVQAEGRPHGPPAIIVSYDLWQSAFEGDPSVVGQTIQMDGSGYVVVGVMPRNFQFVAAADVYKPLQLTFSPDDHDQNYGMVARLRSGIKLEQAQAEAAQVFGEFKKMYPGAVWKGWEGLQFISYHQELTGNVETPLLVLFGAVLLVLLIALTNVTNLFLGRATSRRPEIVLRTALGASRSRLWRQLLTEGLLLSIVSGVLAVLLAIWGLRWLVDFIPHAVSLDLNTSLLPLAGEVRTNADVLVFALLISVAAGVAAALVPYFYARRMNLYDDLKQGRGQGDAGLRRPWLRNVLVAAEIAMSVVLLTGTGLLARSFLKLRMVSPGFDPQNLWALEMSLPPGRYKTTAEAWTLQKKIIERLDAIPGVTGVAANSNLPVTRGLRYPYDIPRCGRFMVQLRAISPDYFSVTGIPLVAGRTFQDTDGANAAIVNSELARRCWPGRNAIGQAVAKETAEGNVLAQVVGVVADTKDGSLNSPTVPVVYVAGWTVSDQFTKLVHSWFLSAWVIRSNAPLNARTVDHAVNSVDPTLPVAHFERMTDFISNSFVLAEGRLLTVLVGGFTALALLLAVIGIYGILSYFVSRQTHEIGVRIALGARKNDVLRIVLSEGLRLALIGLTLGIAGAFAVTRLLSSLLFEVEPTDLVTFTAASVILAGAALAACYIPARRAANVDPMEALRYE
ncbi:MAG: ADOP family duplicated permease [Candidatus Acidiferrales bacterium]